MLKGAGRLAGATGLVLAALSLPARAAASSLWLQENGPGDYDYGRQLVLPAGFGDGEFTLELWIEPDQSYPVGPTTDGTPGQLVNWSDADNAPYSGCCWWYEGNFLLDGHNNAGFEDGTFSLQFYGGGRIRWLFGDGVTAGPGGHWSVGAYPASTTPSLLDGLWHQVTLVRRWSGASSADLELWIDGRLVDTETSPVRTDMRTWWDSWSGFPGGQEGWFWGAEKQAAIGVLSQYEDYKGLLDEVRFWSRAKSPAEIESGWRSPALPGSPGLVGLYALGEGTGTSACDTLHPGECIGLVNMQPGHWSAEEAPLDAGTALRYFGNGAFEVDQVKIRIDAPAVPADVGVTDFTLEFWMKALAAENGAGPCQGGGVDWINGNITFDRDVFGSGDYGDFGISLMGGRWAFGVGSASAGENTICGSLPVADGSWHHVAVTRSAATGALGVFVDGQIDAQGPGPVGDVSYRDGRPTSWPGSDPFLVIGAEKHFGPPAFSGWIDEVRLSRVIRYAGPFTRPSAPFLPDADTMALYHFDEGAGDAIGDVSGAPGGPSPGVRHFGSAGSLPPGPVWVVSDAPLAGPPAQVVTLAFASAASALGEAAGPATAAVVLTTSDGSPTGALATVEYATAGGTATSGVDFVPTSGTLTFVAGAPSGATQPVAVPLLDDTADEVDETFTLSLSSPAGATLGSPSTHTVTILDDDAASLSTLELTHGARLTADLAAGGADHYRLNQGPRASYEVVLDAASGDLVPGLALERLAADNTTVLQSAVANGGGSALSLRFENALPAPVASQHIRVGSPACGALCGPEDVYRLRALETTESIARFNNAGSQLTVLVVQNLAAGPVSGHAYFWSTSGALLATHPFALGARGTLSLNTAAVPGLAGQGGSLTLSHDGGYGALAGKAVALETSTGFAFDSPLRPRPR